MTWVRRNHIFGLCERPLPSRWQKMRRVGTLRKTWYRRTSHQESTLEEILRRRLSLTVTNFQPISTAAKYLQLDVEEQLPLDQQICYTHPKSGGRGIDPAINEAKEAWTRQSLRVADIGDTDRLLVLLNP